MNTTVFDSCCCCCNHLSAVDILADMKKSLDMMEMAPDTMFDDMKFAPLVDRMAMAVAPDTVCIHS